MEKIILKPEGEENPVELYVLEQTRIGGVDYILVTDTESEDEDGQCMVLKDLSKPEEKEALYTFVEEDEELDSVISIFEKMLDDTDIVF